VDKSQQRLRRQASCLFAPGVDPYNTADTVKLSRQLVADFVAWVAGDLPPLSQGSVCKELDSQVGLLRRQAD
jgi:hypothetical protein